jgi:hypothetical protein
MAISGLLFNRMLMTCCDQADLPSDNRYNIQIIKFALLRILQKLFHQVTCFLPHAVKTAIHKHLFLSNIFILNYNRVLIRILTQVTNRQILTLYYLFLNQNISCGIYGKRSRSGTIFLPRVSALAN